MRNLVHQQADSVQRLSVVLVTNLFHDSCSLVFLLPKKVNNAWNLQYKKYSLILGNRIVKIIKSSSK